MGSLATLQSESGGFGSYAYDCYINLKMPDCTVELIRSRRDTAIWVYQRVEEDYYKLRNDENFDIFLGVEPSGTGTLIATENGNGDDTLWYIPQTPPLGTITLQTQIGGYGGDLFDCYLSVDPDRATFYFTRKKTDNGIVVGIWDSTRV